MPQNILPLCFVIIISLSSSFLFTATEAAGSAMFPSFQKKSNVLRTSPESRGILSALVSQAASRCDNFLLGSRCCKNLYSIVIPPLLVFILGTLSCQASVLNQQPISIRGPFFQGWLMRTVDHANSRSMILIIGSFSSRGSSCYDEHYIFCGVSTKSEGTYHFEAFPERDSVTVTGSAPSVQTLMANFRPSLSKETNITWSVKDVGYFKFNNEECSADFKLGGAHIKLSTKNRKPWSKSNIYSAGPEGWLGYTALLPCHYFVHSVGSDCNYVIRLPSKSRSEDTSGSRNPPSANDFKKGSAETREIIGSGYTHIEGNYGSFFPSGWVWSQAISPSNKASFSLTGGKFEIGIFAPITFILFVRIGEKTKIFRTTGLDAFLYDVDGIVGYTRIIAHSFSKRDRVEVIIRPKSSIAKGSFGTPLYIPTANGFSNNPGCIETYTADADVTCSELDGETSEYVVKSRTSFPLTALEFGGSFQGIRSQSRRTFRDQEIIPIGMQQDQL